MAESDHSSVEAQASELLQQVMRGERFIWIPPGGLAWGALIPSLCFAYSIVAGMLVTGFGGAGERGDPLPRFAWTMGITLGMLLASTIPHVMVLQGHATGRTWVIRVVGTLSLLGMALSAWSLFGAAESNWGSAALCLASLMVPNLLVHSEAYLSVTCYMSLKRKWELEHKARVDEILAQGRKRRGKRR